MKLKSLEQWIEVKRNYHKILVVLFGICVIFWGYLFFNTRMSILFDATGYEESGRMISEKGWKEYFITGPNREPLYPFSIGFSMVIAEKWGVDYQFVQKGLQITLLLITQFFFLLTLDKLKIHNSIKLIMVLYLGLSPAVINATFSLFSEIISFPFSLIIVLICVKSAQSILNGKHVFIMSLLSGVVFILAAFSKAVYKYVFLFYIGFLGIMILYWLIKKKWKLVKSVIGYALAVFCVFQLGMSTYMNLNKKYNGNYQFTNRFDWAFFGMASKRTSYVTPDVYLAHIASIPGRGFCRFIFEEWDCRFCEHYASDYHAQGFLPNILKYKKVSNEDKQSETIKLAFEAIKNNPVQYFAFYLIEFPKMFFWESTRVGFVQYPQWLDQLHNNKFIRYGVRFGISILTTLAVLFMILRVFKNRTSIIEFNNESVENQLCFFVLLIIFIFTALYACHLILVRMRLPLSPLFLVCIAYYLNHMIFLRKKANVKKV